MLALSTIDLNTGLTPQNLAETLVGGGVAISNVEFTGDNSAAGLFAGGLSEGLDVEFGVMLSSGNIADAAGPNDQDGTTTAFGLPGDSDLDGLIPGFFTNDATVLEFDFVADAGIVTFQYVFGSEEYNEFVGSDFNDVFGFFLDGENIALIPGTTTPVSINNVNNGLNSSFYNDNDPGDLGTPTPFVTEADGFTIPLQATATVAPGTHHIKLAIADAGDTILDSWVFLTAESFVSGESDLEIAIADSPEPVVVDNPLTYTLVATNNGPDRANGVTVEDTLPAGVTFVSANASQGTVFHVGGVVLAELGSLATGASASVEIVVVPTALGTITNTAAVTAFQPDPETENNTAFETTLVELPRVSVDDVQVAEGNAGTTDAVFTVSLNGADLNSVITVGFQTLDVTATALSDYVPRGGVLTFAPGTLAQVVTVPIVGDRINERAESFQLRLSDSNAEISKGIGVGTIIDDDPLPHFYVNDVQVTRMPAGVWAAVFTVALDAPSGREVVVDFKTVNGSAIDGVDYNGQTGDLTFVPGVTTQHVTVPVLTDGAYTSNKNFYLNLANPVSASIADSQGTATFVYAGGPVGEYIIDDGDPGYQRTNGWTNLTNTLAYQLDYDYRAAGTGDEVATWMFADLPTGTYQVFARWSWFVNRATNAPYTILDGVSPLGTVLVNQQAAPVGDHSEGITWQSLGNYQIDSGNLIVRLANNADGFVVADAVRIVAGGIRPQEPEMDVAGFEHSIGIDDNTPSPEDGTDFGPVPVLTDSLVHTFTVTNNGNADLHLTGAPRVTVGGPHAADFTVIRQPADTVAPTRKTTFDVVFHPSEAAVRTAVISISNDDDSEHPYAFAVRGTGTLAGSSQLVMDDSMPGFLRQGNWTMVPDGLAYHGQMLTANAQENNQAVWDFNGLPAGMYDVYTTWVPSDSRTTGAQFEVSNLSDHAFTATVNQQQAPAIAMDSANWANLGALYVVAGSLQVSLANVANGTVVADAVMISHREGGVLQEAAIAHNAALPQDVNNDGRVSAVDVLIVINNMLARNVEAAVAPLAGSSGDGPTSTYFVDVNADGRVSPVDLLMVINYLLAQQSATPSAAALLDDSAGTNAALTAVAVDQAIGRGDELEEVALPPRVELVAPGEVSPSGESRSGALLESAGIESLLSSQSEAETADLDLLDSLLPEL